MDSGKKDNLLSLYKRQSFVIRLLINIGLMIMTAIVLGWLVLTWLDSWTHHGQYSVIPDVKGKGYYTAVHELRDQGFDAELSDSIYGSAGLNPGTVVEQSPKPGTKVKEGRKLYLTITAFSPKTVTLPALTDVSVRQARSVLEGLGINKIKIDTVPSEYRGLVLGVKASGARLSPGARIPVTTAVTLEVGAGLSDAIADSIKAEAEVIDFSSEQLDID